MLGNQRKVDKLLREIYIDKFPNSKATLSWYYRVKDDGVFEFHITTNKPGMVIGPHGNRIEEVKERLKPLLGTEAILMCIEEASVVY